jgi:acyl-CoA hydrolase
MENHKLVLPEHLSHYGYLFGGYLLKWVDEYAWIAATLDYPGCNFVTVGLDEVEFKKSVKGGTILRFLVEEAKRGSTSVQYRVNVFRGQDDLIFSTHVTLVSIDEQGKKAPLPK